MRQALVKMHDIDAGILFQNEDNSFRFEYFEGYRNAPISLTMPTTQKIYTFANFPAFFDGLLPEGGQLDGLLKSRKIDSKDFFSQLIAVGGDMVGAVTVFEK